MIEGQIKYDVCIVGSGPAGSFAANELLNAGKTVAIIEVGNEKIHNDFMNIIDLDGSNISGDINIGLSNQIGGTSNLWGGWLVKFNKIDFIERKLFNLNGWPIKYEEILRYYKKVDKYLNLNGSIEQNYNSSNLQIRESEIMTHPFNTSKIINENIKFFENTEALKINVNNDLTGIESITCLNKKNNNLSKIYAKQFILASGGINNVRIMLHSFKDLNIDHLFNYRDIGKCISTHPKADVGTIRLYSTIKNSSKFLNTNKFKSSYIKTQVGIIDEYLIKNNLLNHCIRITQPNKNRIIKLVEKISAYCLSTQKSIIKSFFLSKLFIYLGRLLLKIIEIIEFSNKKNKSLSVRCFFDQERRDSNKIELSSKKSRYGIPLVKITWNFEKKDWQNVDSFLNFIKNELKELEVGDFDYQVPGKYIGIHSHFMGGTVMGKKRDDGSIVDKNLKVHGIDNLYISGPSVFPSFGYANPFYTIAALSIRLSDHLKTKL